MEYEERNIYEGTQFSFENMKFESSCYTERMKLVRYARNMLFLYADDKVAAKLEPPI